MKKYNRFFWTTLVLIFISIENVWADTEHMLDIVVNVAKWVIYALTAISWISLLIPIYRNEEPVIAIHIAIAMICCITGIKTISATTHMAFKYREEISSAIDWGLMIVVLNILPVIIATYQRIFFDYE